MVLITVPFGRGKGIVSTGSSSGSIIWFSTGGLGSSRLSLYSMPPCLATIVAGRVVFSVYALDPLSYKLTLYSSTLLG